MNALEMLAQWGPLGMLIVIGFLWIWRVERNLERHEGKCTERYSLIFSELSKLRQDVATLLERTKQ